MGHHNAKNFDTQKVDRVMSPFRVFYVVNRGESVSGLVPHTSRSRGTSLESRVLPVLTHLHRDSNPGLPGESRLS